MKKKWLFIFGAIPLIGCGVSRPPLKTVDNMDLQRYMGPWYVIACIPTVIEKQAFNAVETYNIDKDGSINTVFTFNKGSFDGPEKRYNPRGFVVDRVNNSTWKMQFIWPFKSEYLITHLKDDYSQAIVGRNKRDYAWILARTPEIPEADYQRWVDELKLQGYDVGKLRRVPQQSIAARR